MSQHLTLLGALIEARGTSQREECRAFNAKAAANHERDAALSVRTLRRWITGDVATRPRPAQCRVAQSLWGRPMEQLLRPPSPEALLGDDETTVGDEADVSVTTERQVTMAARRAAEFTAATESGGIGQETVDQLRDDVRDLAAAYLRDPVTTLVGPLAQTQDGVFAHLEARQRPSQAADLYFLAGVVSALLAKMSQDVGRPREAMTQARTAYVCADNAGHSGLRAWSRGLQSLITYWAGRPSEAARYARLGAAELGGGAGSVAAWLPALEARAWALVSAAAETSSAIARATDARSAHAVDDLDEIGGLFEFSTAKQHYYAAGALVHLDGTAGAAEAATDALRLYDASEDESYSDAAGARAELALARVIAGEVDGAGEALTPVLQLAPERRITGIVASAARVDAALRRPAMVASPVARTIRGEIEAFTRVPAAELPR
jgi:hypothetical protein